MSFSPPAGATPPAGPPGGPTKPGETCPLCGCALQAEQDWCLRCGAAARTRLAAPPKWKALAIGVALVAILAFAVLAAALVRLLG